MENKEERRKAIKESGIKYGVVIALLGVLYFFIPYLLNPSLLGNVMYGIMLWGLKIVNLIILVFAVLAVRKQFDGFISFRDAFSAYMIPALISVLVVFSFTLLLFNVVDPGVVEEIKESSIVSTIELMEKMGGAQEQVDEAIADLEKRFDEQYSIKSQAMQVGILILGNAIIGLLVAAILRKEQPMWENEANTEN